MRADRRSGLDAVREVLALQHLLQRGLGQEAKDIRGGHRGEPFRVAADLDLLAVQNDVQLFEVRLCVLLDLVFREHRPRFRTPTRIADHRRVVADDHDHGVALVLKHPQRVEHHQVPHMKVRSGRIETQLHAQPVAALEAPAQVVLDVDLHCPLAQAFEKLAAQRVCVLRD